ncbi:MAG TPA: hypothetical protein VF458_19340 [Ktedonobacteraceae bacterium]
MNTATSMPTPIAAPDSLLREVEQLADLLARIYVRCLQEQDPQVLARLAETTSAHQEVKHAAA